MAESRDRAILSDLDGTLIDSKASVIAAFRWWAESRGLPPDTADRIPHGRTSTDAVAVLAPHLDAAVEGAELDRRQAEHTVGVVALPGARELLSNAEQIAIVTSCPAPLAQARLEAAGLPVPRVLITRSASPSGNRTPSPTSSAPPRSPPSRTPAWCSRIHRGVQSGLAAGMTVIALLTTHARDELPGAHAYIASLHDLPSILTNRNQLGAAWDGRTGPAG